MRTRISGLLVVLWLLLAAKADATGYTLTINIQGSGTVARNPTNSVYPSGAVVTLTATPAAGWIFSAWSGDASGTNNPLNVTMDTNKVIIATFLQLPTYALTLTTNGQGAISLSPPGDMYLSNTVVTATATPAASWVFVSWSGSASGTSNSISITVNSNSSLAGTFAQLPAFDMPPHNITNAIGSTVSFMAHSVGDPPLSYQWFFGTGPLPRAISGALTLTNAQLTNAGNYWIEATNN